MVRINSLLFKLSYSVDVPNDDRAGGLFRPA